MIHKILRKPQAIFGLLMMLTVFAVMLFAPALAPNDPEKINIMQKFAEPSEQYLMTWGAVSLQDCFTVQECPC